MHSFERFPLENVPAGHAIQCADARGAKNPALQASHLSARASVPAGQAMHAESDLAPAREMVPGGQFLQAEFAERSEY